MKSQTLLALLGCALAQKPARYNHQTSQQNFKVIKCNLAPKYKSDLSLRIGPDGKPLLNRPDIDECMKSE